MLLLVSGMKHFGVQTYIQTDMIYPLLVSFVHSVQNSGLCSPEALFWFFCCLNIFVVWRTVEETQILRNKPRDFGSGVVDWWRCDRSVDYVAIFGVLSTYWKLRSFECYLLQNIKLCAVFRRFFYLPIMGGGVQTGSTRHRGQYWPIVPAPHNRWCWL
jgi:hypothetical protein